MPLCSSLGAGKAFDMDGYLYDAMIGGRKGENSVASLEHFADVVVIPWQDIHDLYNHYSKLLSPICLYYMSALIRSRT